MNPPLSICSISFFSSSGCDGRDRYGGWKDVLASFVSSIRWIVCFIIPKWPSQISWNFDNLSMSLCRWFLNSSPMLMIQFCFLMFFSLFQFLEALIACFRNRWDFWHSRCVYFDDNIMLGTETVRFLLFLRVHVQMVYHFRCRCGYSDSRVFGYPFRRLRKICNPYVEWLIVLYLCNPVCQEALV